MEAGLPMQIGFKGIQAFCLYKLSSTGLDDRKMTEKPS